MFRVKVMKIYYSNCLSSPISETFPSDLPKATHEHHKSTLSQKSAPFSSQKFFFFLALSATFYAYKTAHDVKTLSGNLQSF